MENIIEGNKLIAEFMGVSKEQSWFNYPREYPFVIDDKNRQNKIRRILPDELKYHSSWDWLMPVVQKVLSTDSTTFDSYQLWVEDSLRTADINKVFEMVIDFVKQHKQRLEK